MIYQHNKIHITQPLTYYLLLASLISTINCHGSFKTFINPPNLIKHLTVNSLKIVKGKQLDHKIQQFYWLTLFFTFNYMCICKYVRFVVANQIENMPCGIQWPMIHLPSHKMNYIFIYFVMPLKMDDINLFFIFIFTQINISHKYKLHMQL